MKTILYYHPVGDYNIGDDITFAGAKELITKAIGNHHVKTAYKEDSEEITPDIVEGIDALVLGGTPWLWDRDEESGKHKALNYLISLIPNIPKIALGIGSGYPITTIPIEGSGAADVWRKFSFIHTRDSLASSILQSSGINNTYSFCTSAYAPIYNNEISNNDKRPVVVYHTPNSGVAHSVLNKDFIDAYDFYMHRVIRRYNARVLAVEQHEADILKPHGIEVFVPKKISDVTEFLQGASFVLSGRVHIAIPAARIGIPTYIIPVDSRWLTTIPFGIIPIYEKQFKEADPYLLPFKPIDNSQLIEFESNKIVESICQYL